MNSFNVTSSPISHGLTLLEASAGTGKTYSLVRIIARHLVENHLPIEEILTVTFTRAATAEIKSRLHELLSEISLHFKNPPSDKDKINDLVSYWTDTKDPEFIANAQRRIATALANFDSVPIFTIDGFFQRLLKEFSFEANQLFSVDLETNEAELIQTALHDYWRQHVYHLDADRLSIFQSLIKFDKVQSFITEALRTPDAIFDKAYQTDINSQLSHYQSAWNEFTSLLATHHRDLFAFITNPPSEFQKRGYPFFKKGASMCEILEEILNHPTPPQLNLSYLSKLSFSSLQSDAAFNKGKSIDLSQHTLAGFFHSIDKLKQTTPQHLTSAYFGSILHFVKSRLTALKKERNVQTYTDVSNTLATLFEKKAPTSQSIKKSIKQKYSACLIDEFQDTSPQQSVVFLNLFKHNDRYFHIIGDPKQSIYRFRGADVFSYIHAKNQKNYEFNLLTNFRSSPRMIHAINQLFSMSDDPFLVDGQISFSKVKWKNQGEETTPPPAPSSSPAALTIHTLSPEIKNNGPIRETYNKSITSEILQLLGKSWASLSNEKTGVVQPSDIAILVRSAADGERIYQSLLKLNIPANLDSRSSLLKSPESDEIFTILTALLEPQRSDLLRMALLTAPLGSGARLDKNDNTDLDALIQTTSDLHKKWERYGLMPMMLDFIQSLDVRNTLLSLPQGQRRLTNFMHLIEVLDHKARTAQFTPTATVQWLEMAIQDHISDLDSEVLELRISTDDDAVQIRTQHTSKGLEFPIVFVTPSLSNHPPALSYHQFNSQNSNSQKKNNQLYFSAVEEQKDTPIYQQRLRESQADSARLLYVALTRAKYLCHFYIPLAKKEDTALIMLANPTQNDFKKLADESSESICFSPIDSDTLFPNLTPWVAQSSHKETPQLTTRPTQTIQITNSHRTTSFSGITRRMYHQEVHFDIGSTHDVDAPLQNQTTPTTTPPEADKHTEASFWNRFQAGASLGLVFHDILEDLDFQDVSQSDALISKKLEKYNPWKPDFLTSNPSQKIRSTVADIKSYLQDLVSHPLSDSGISLNQISQSKRLSEPEFLLTGQHFSLYSLQSILSENPPENLPKDYLRQLHSLKLISIDGFLNGFIDLIFESNGRYHLLDWKTNQLDSYTPESIAASMADHHYYLQYHLYTLALDRFLRLRLSDSYDPEIHLGDVYYVYLRGIDPSTPGSGIFSDTITPPRLLALRKAFASI